MFDMLGLKIALRVKSPLYTTIRTATKRTSGTSASSSNSAGRRLGPKKSENEFVKPGQIIWRQRGTKFYPGENCGIGRDHTIFALEPGYVRFYRDPFHAKRKFIGVALKQEYRLPTPHFEPRRRRFGYTLITDDKSAKFEEDFLTRKETKETKSRKIEEEKVLNDLEIRLSNYKEFCKSVDLELNHEQACRLDSIYQYMQGGKSYTESAEIVKSILLNDLEIDLNAARIQSAEYQDTVNQLYKDIKTVDSKVRFGNNLKLVLVTEVSEDAKMNAISELDKLTKDLEYTPPSVVSQINTIIRNCAAFSSKDAAHLKRKYVKFLKPVPITAENKKEFEEKSAKKEGEIKLVHIRDDFQRYFIPKGARLIFDL